MARRLLALLASLLLLLMVPVALAARGADAVLFDTGSFAEFTSALVRDSGVRADIIDNFTSTVMESAEPSGLVSKSKLAAAGLTEEQFAAALETVVRNAVTSTVDSDRFAVLWTDASKAAHQSFLAALDAGAGATAPVTVDMSAIVGEISARLTDDEGKLSGLVKLDRIVPADADLKFDILDADAVDSMRDVRKVTSLMGWLTPSVALVALLSIVVSWPVRRTGLRIGGVVTATGAVLLFVARSVGRSAVSSGGDPGVGGAAFDAATSGLTVPAGAVLVLGVLLVLASFARRQTPGS